MFGEKSRSTVLAFAILLPAIVLGFIVGSLIIGFKAGKDYAASYIARGGVKLCTD